MVTESKPGFWGFEGCRVLGFRFEGLRVLGFFGVWGFSPEEFNGNRIKAPCPDRTQGLNGRRQKS